MSVGLGSSAGVISGKCSVVVGGPDTTQDDEGSASDAEVSSIDFSGESKLVFRVYRVEIA